MSGDGRGNGHGGGPADPGEGVPALPPREPHPLLTHMAIDTAVVFLATLVLGLILGIPFVAILVIAIVAGVCLAPYTRRTEERQLAERRHPPGDGGHGPLT